MNIDKTISFLNQTGKFLLAEFDHFVLFRGP